MLSRCTPPIPHLVPAILFHRRLSSIPSSPSSSRGISNTNATGTNGSSTGETIETDIVSRIALSEHSVVRGQGLGIVACAFAAAFCLFTANQKITFFANVTHHPPGSPALRPHVDRRVAVHEVVPPGHLLAKEDRNQHRSPSSYSTSRVKSRFPRTTRRISPAFTIPPPLHLLPVSHGSPLASARSSRRTARRSHSHAHAVDAVGAALADASRC